MSVWFKIAALFLFSLNILSIKVITDLKDYDYLSLIFLDVGQGDAILIKTPFLQNILIDSGPSQKAIEGKLSKYIPFWRKKIDLFVATHPEKDHIGGALKVFENYNVSNVIYNGVKKETNLSKRFEDYIKSAKFKKFIGENGLNVYISDTNKSKPLLSVVYPFQEFEGITVKNANDTSIVSKVFFGEFSALLTGDISYKTEKKILSKNIESDILKVPHHGSNSSSSAIFLEKVSPKYSVIMVDRNNRYGHPDNRVLSRILDSGSNILRTDILGDIKFISDGKSYIVSI